MANEKNLKPFNTRTESEQREIARAGGIASGEARRERKKFREHLLESLATGNIQEDIVIALIDRAKSGDIAAFKTIRDTIGENLKSTEYNPFSLF